MKKIIYYIGENNTTHTLEAQKALDILAQEYEGMTVSEVVGYWKGSQEKTLQVQIVCESVDYTQIKRVSRAICTELDQEAVMVEVLDSNTLFISNE